MSQIALHIVSSLSDRRACYIIETRHQSNWNRSSSTQVYKFQLQIILDLALSVWLLML